MKPTTLQGALAGLLATVPMTLAMKGLQHLSKHPHRAVPPREITRNSAREVGIPLEANSSAETLLTALAHFGYGAAAGSTYTQCLVGLIKPGVASGVTYGLGVWAINYLGLMPALRLQPPAEDQPEQRNSVMIAAHAVWGAALGFVAERMSRPKHGNRPDRNGHAATSNVPRRQRIRKASNV